MTEKKIDRRVRRTRRRLRQSLIELILAHGYENITIQHITDHADLSRATFYLHYKDKDELLVNSLESMFDELVKSLKQPFFSRDGIPQDQPLPSLIAFQHVQEYSALYKALLLGERGVSYVIHRSLEYLARVSHQQILQIVSKDELHRLPVPPEIIAWSNAGSLFAIILWWLDNDMPFSAETMAEQYMRLVTPAVYSGLGLVEVNTFIKALPDEGKAS